MRPVRLAALALVVALVPAALAVGLALRRWLRPPNVIVIVADTLRADRLGAYGNPRGLTPFLDELAARGTVFANAYAASSWTCPSVASLFTSRYPSQHHVGDFDSKLPDAEVTLAERLQDVPYVGGGFSANLRLTRALGYGQGFTGWFPFASERKVTAARLGRKSLAWLDVAWNWRARRPLFLYYQFMEPHAPYAPEEEAHAPDGVTRALRRRLGLRPEDAGRVAEVNALLTDMRWDLLTRDDVAVLEHLYDIEVASLDARLRVLFAGLEQRGVLDDAIVVFTADHGEEFRDHGQLSHGTSLFNELIRVPLIVLAPGWPGGRVVRENVSLVDVAPTVLDLLRLAPEPRFEGRSLVPLAAGTEGRADVLAELPPVLSAPLDLGRHRLALVRGPLKVLLPSKVGAAKSRPAFYDLAADPRETEPDPPALAGEARAGFHAARRSLATLVTRAGTAERGVVDAHVRDRLRALGYLN